MKDIIVINNIGLEHLKGYQLKVASDQYTYMINNRKNGNLSRLHAHSPQVPGAKLAQGTALYVISCEFKGGDMKYSENKFDAVKAYLDVLGVEYRVLICNILPRHNWKHRLRTKEIDFARYDELLKSCQFDGKQAAELFYQETESALESSQSLRYSEQEIEALSYKITLNANQARVKQCQKIFSADKVILWSDMYENIPELVVTYQEALKGCNDTVVEGAKNREGNLEDNIRYQQEELVVDLHVAHMIEQKPVIGFYNEFSSHKGKTGYMEPCKAYGHFPVMDILFEEEKKITDALLEAGLILKKEMKPADPEKQLAHCVRLFPRLQLSLQKEFVLQLLERSKMQFPSQVKFIESCLQLYKTLDASLQLQFLSDLLDHPKRKIAAYYAFLNSLSVYYSTLFDPSVGPFMISYVKSHPDPHVYSSSDPLLLFGQQEVTQSHVQKVCMKRYDKFTPFAHSKLMLSKVPSANLTNESNASTSMIDIAIDAGANLDIEDGTGITPLYRSIVFGKLELSKVLLKAGVRLDEENLAFAYEYLNEGLITWSNEPSKVKVLQETISLVDQYHKNGSRQLRK